MFINKFKFLLCPSKKNMPFIILNKNYTVCAVKFDITSQITAMIQN